MKTGEIGYRSLLGEVKTLLGPDIQEHGSDTLQGIFDDYHKVFPPFEGTELVSMLGQRSRYARAWAEFMETYSLVLSPFLLQPFFAPARDTEGVEGVTEVLGQAHWSFCYELPWSTRRQHSNPCCSIAVWPCAHRCSNRWSKMARGFDRGRDASD